MTLGRLATLAGLCAVLAVPVSAAAQAGGKTAPAAKSAAPSASPPGSDQACFAADVVQDLEQCPTGAKRGTMASLKGGHPATRLREAERKKPKAKQVQKGPKYEISEAQRTGRKASTERKSWQLLQREVAILKRLVANTPKDDPKRPDILLRLAETYFEMQQSLDAKVRSYDDPIFKACTQEKNAAKCSSLRNGQKKAQASLNGVRQETIRTYAILVHDHPDFRRMDEVLFALAFGLEQMGQMQQARQVYMRLIKNYPQSRFIPHAYLSFAEFFFNDNDMEPARKFYDKVLEFPADKNPVYGYAMYKEAWVYYNEQNFKKSLEQFVNVIQFANDHPGTADVKNLARQARHEMVMPYAQVGSPSKAYNFFRRYATDDKQAMKMLESLAELYYDTGQWDSAIATYHDLMARDSASDKLCAWEVKVTNAVISSKPKNDQVRELKRLVDLYDTYATQKRPADDKTVCKQQTATIIVSLATAWHREAVGTSTQPGTGDTHTMDLAAALYQELLLKFPDLDNMKFPDIDRRDWPTKYSIAYYMAELLWKREDWEKCGPAFDKVVELDPQGKYTQDAAYAAVLCYNNLYQAQYKSRETETRSENDKGKKGKGSEGDYAKRDFTPLEKGMLRAFQRYVCYISDSSELPTIKYRRARIYYEANHFEEAALLFKDIALHHSDTDLGVYAANLYLDSLNVLATKVKDKKPQCLDEMQNVLDPFNNLYCNTPSKAEENSELCDPIKTLKCQLIRKKAEAYQSKEEFKKAASTYIGLFREHQECAALQQVKMDEVLYDAAINLEAAKLLGAAIQVRNVLIQKFPDSPLSKRSIYLLGANWHAIAMYDKAADYYEQFASKFPGEDGSDCTAADKKNKLCPIASEALMNAIFFRLGLGQGDQAKDDVKLFEKNYSRKLPRKTSQVVFALGSIYERTNDWNNLIDHYRLFLKKFRRGALPSQKIMANVQIARAYWQKKDRDSARKYYAEAVKVWKHGAPRQIDRLDGTQEEKVGWLKDAIDGTAESLFYLAEFAYSDFQRIHFPQYKGGKSLERVNLWSKKKFMPWVQKKLKALHEAEKEYNKVASLQVKVQSVTMQSAPWEIAAAARIGEMYKSFVDSFRNAPVPEEVEKDPELYDIYVGALDEQSKPLLEQAKQKFEFCLKTATNVRWFNEWSRQCERELSDLDPHTYPMAAELRGEPNFVYQDIAKPGPAALPTEGENTSLGAAAQTMGDTGAKGGAK